MRPSARGAASFGTLRPRSASPGSFRPLPASSLDSIRPLPASARLFSAPPAAARPFPARAMAAGRRSPPGRCCPSRVAVPSVHQSLPEMDFERALRQPQRAPGGLPAAAAAGCPLRRPHARRCHPPAPRQLLRPPRRRPATAGPRRRPGCRRRGRPHQPAQGGWQGRDVVPHHRGTGLAGGSDDGRVTRRRLNEATGNSASCSCGTARRWPASATPRADGPVTWPTRRCRTCWIPEGDTAGPGEPEPPRRRTPGAAGPRLRWINEAPGTQRRLCLSVPCAGCRGSPLSGGLAAAGGVTAPFFGCQPFPWLLFPQKNPLKIGQIVFCRTRKHRRASVWWGHPVPAGSVPRWGSRHRAPSPQLVPQPPAPTPVSSRERRGGRKASVLALRFLVGRFGVACGRANSSR
ncbi:ankyrin repeat domain-containing protein 39 isoform X1 [Ciconia boyciana]|uniref:ankyrin repeat domain-containing protein 39 isoform X1 n=1 Tax=Ciconia boyciana TaxID=52775 RepID=UPI003BA3431A